MSVEFDEQGGALRQQVTQSLSSNEPTGLVALVIKWGIADSEAKANKVLLISAIVFFVLTFLVIVKFIL